MGSFSKHSKSEAKVKEAKKLIDDNKLNEAIELCEKEINELKDLKIEEQKLKKILHLKFVTDLGLASLKKEDMLKPEMHL